MLSADLVLMLVQSLVAFSLFEPLYATVTCACVGVCFAYIGIRARSGTEKLQPPKSGEQFFGQQPVARNEKSMYIFLYFLNEKMEFIPSSEMKWQKSDFIILLDGVS